jgi:beta-1,4-mannosyl-glycoprotein beta-1,4-N-acetylglucosaminyltransferase
MLECRLDYLYQKVDKFVLVEANVTHSGQSKPFYYLENISRYKKFLDKIISIQVNIEIDKLDWNFDLSKNFENASWKVENKQRNAILKGLTNCLKNDIIMISDLDEIPKLESIDRAVRLLDTKLFVVLEGKQFYYNLNQCLIEPWNLTVLGRYSDVKLTTPQQLRSNRNNFTKILNSGWHLTYFGGSEMIKNKIKNFAHQEYNNSKFTDIKYIEEKIKTGKELYGRVFPMTTVSLDSFPNNFLQSFQRFKMSKYTHYYENVYGWFSAQDAEMYKKAVNQFPSGSHFVEIGSYKGRSSAFMAVEIANSGKQIKFDCVDTWEGSIEHQRGGGWEDADVVNRQLFEVFQNNMKPVSDYFNIVRLPSIQAAITYQDKSLDFVFIDAAHDYHNVVADINAWKSKVKIGGILSGHDWHHPPIKQAIEHTIGNIDGVLGDCWYITIK